MTRDELAAALGIHPMLLPGAPPPTAPVGGRVISDPNLVASNLEFSEPAHTFSPEREDRLASDATVAAQQKEAAFLRAVDALGSKDIKKAAPLLQAAGVDPGVFGVTPEQTAEQTKIARSSYERSLAEKGERSEAEKRDAAAKLAAGAVYDIPPETHGGSPVSSIDKLLVPSSSGGVIPGHGVRRVTPETEAMLRAAGKEQEAAIQELGAAKGNLALAQGEEAMGLAGVREGLRLQAVERENARQATIDKHLADQAAIADGIRNFKIDPDHAFGDGVFGGFRKIAAIIAVGLGGWASGLKGGPNVAAQMIESMIDKDIDAQKTELEKRKGLLAESRSLLAQKMQQFGDQRIAEAAAKADVLEAAKAAGEARLAGARSDMERAGMNALLGELHEKLGKQNDQIESWQGPQAVGDPRRKAFDDLVQKLVMAKTPVDQAKAMAFQTVYNVDVGAGDMAIPSSKGHMHPKFVQGFAAIKDMMSAIDNEIQLAQDSNVGVMDRKTRSSINMAALNDGLPLAFSNRMSDKQVEIWKNAISSVQDTGYTLQMRDARVNSLKYLRQRLEERLHTLQKEVSNSGPVGGEKEEDAQEDPLTTAEDLK